MFSFKYFLIGLSLGAILLSIFFLTLPDNRLHIVFCDVGQGDAAYIRFPTGEDMLIDGGPDDRVLSCLGKSMPFYDRTIDMLMVSHPQKDHLYGFLSVIDRYKIGNMILGMTGQETEEYKNLVTKIQNKHIPVKNLFAGDTITLGRVVMHLLWPEREWVLSHIDSAQTSGVTHLTSSAGEAVLGYKTETDLNGFSYYLHLQYGNFDALFTGDGDQPVQPEILKRGGVPDVEVLKFPHHGSKTGLSDALLSLIRPEFSIISVGKRNTYGHPSKEAIELLHKYHSRYARTDEKGSIEVVTDGKSWETR